MSWIDLAVGAGIAATAYSSGHGIGLTRGKLAEKRKHDTGPELICSCAHGFGSHENRGKCHGTTERANKWKSFSTYPYERPCAWESVSCTCLAYDGPEPLPDVLSWQPPKEIS